MSDPQAADETVVDSPAPELIHGIATISSRGQVVVHPSRGQYVALIKKLIDDGFHLAVDLTAVDYLEQPRRDLPAGVTGERFEVVVNLLDLTAARRLRVRVQVPAEDPKLPSLFEQFPGTEAMEREVFDMFGVAFDGHPDLTRILMPEDWIGHPLRKDYAVGRIPVQFKGAAS
jgi:NADH-quinone oxidoreductase subunit C